MRKTSSELYLLPKTKKIVCAVIFFIALLIATAAIIFSFTRWCVADDSQDIQGTWIVDNSDTTIQITDNEIRMTSDMIFTYSLDTGSKTIKERLDDKEGSAHYVFSQDRNELVIIDVNLDVVSSYFFDAGNLLNTAFSGNYKATSAPFLSNDDDSNVTRLKRAS